MAAENSEIIGVTPVTSVRDPRIEDRKTIYVTTKPHEALVDTVNRKLLSRPQRLVATIAITTAHITLVEGQSDPSYATGLWTDSTPDESGQPKGVTIRSSREGTLLVNLVEDGRIVSRPYYDFYMAASYEVEGASAPGTGSEFDNN
jgi:hypothetical protein